MATLRYLLSIHLNNMRLLINIKLLYIAVCVVIAGNISAQTNVWQPPAGHIQIPLWEKDIPDSQPMTGPEFMRQRENLVANKPWISVERVSQPTMTVYPPKGKNSGAAVVVFPGGGYQCIAIDLEGTEICEWLASIGVTAILLKYRVPHSGPYWDPDCNCHKDPVVPMALQDAQRTIGLVRFHANQWHINPRKIGVIGFSAGGHLVADISTHFKKRIYPVKDSADNLSCRPDFGMVIYPGHLLEKTTREFELNPTIPVSKNTPPMFLLQSADDPVDNIQNSLVYFIALKKAGVPVEYHVYPQGGHAFGLRKTSAAITNWPQLAEIWLKTIGII
jgi:acetyl esterase/lipase